MLSYPARIVGSENSIATERDDRRRSRTLLDRGIRATHYDICSNIVSFLWRT